MADDYYRGIGVECFNACWTLIEKTERSLEDDQEMRRLAEVSFWAWRQSSACTPREVAIGLWQLARVYAISGLPDQARQYAEQCLAAHEEVEFSDFYWGYAWEALARAAQAGGDTETAAAALKKVRKHLSGVSDPEDRSMLEADLESLEAAAR